MWRWVVSALVLWDTITSQPVSEDLGNVKLIHPLGIECCPCPGSSSADGDPLVADSFVAASSPREVNMDDCPCRFRGPDSEGSPSVFLPREVHPVRALLKPADPKEDTKPLLHPEVDLASSVLETLREATDEEYNDALARDAARNAANNDPLLGDTASEAAKNVVIVINPSNRDSDALPEASNAQEVRFAHPLSRPSLGKVRDEPLRGIFKVDPELMRRKIEDMEEGASNLKENVVMNRALEDLRLKSDPSILKLFPKPKSIDSGSLKNLFKLRESNLKSSITNNNTKRLNISPAFKKIPEFKLSPALKKLSESKPLKPLDLTLPKWSLSKSWKQKNNSNDGNTSPSNVDEQFVEVTKGRSVPRLGLPSLFDLDLSATRKAPFAFKNLLKLKDVELMSPRSTKVSIEIPFLKPVSSVNEKLISTPVNKDCGLEQTSIQSNVQLIPRGKKAKTEILDTLPSASENNQVITVNENSLQQQDSLSNVSENNQVINTDENSLKQQVSLNENESGNVATGTGQQFVDSSEGTITSNEEIDVELNQNIGQAPIQQVSKVSEGGEQDFDYFNDSFEFIIDENGDSGIDQIILDIGNEQLNSEINMGEESIPVKEESNEVFDVNGHNINESPFSEEIDFGGIVDGDKEIITSDHAVETDSVVLEKEAEKEQGTRRFSSAAKCGCETKNIPEKENQFMKENRNAEILNQEKLPNLKESIVLRLHNLQKPNGKILSLSRITKQDVKNIIENNERSALDGTTIVEKSAHVFDDGTNTKDLQDVSDSSLLQSYTDQDVRASSNFNCKSDVHRTLNPNDPTQLDDENAFSDNSDEDIHVSNLETLDSIHHTDIVETVTDSSVPFDQNDEHDVANVDFNQGVAQNFNKEPTCQAHIDKKGASKSVILDEVTESNSQEMAVGASEHRVNIFPTLTQQVLEPPSLFHSSILNPPVLPNLGDLLNGNSQLPPVPSLEDITTSISNLFQGNVESAKDEDLLSSEFDPNSDCTDDNPVMASDASTTNTKAISGFQNPFQNINLDIFQLSPLSQSSPLAYKIPNLNLNSFKTKLAIPNTFDIRPVKLQSSLGKDGSLLGATLTFDPPKFGAQNARTPMFRSNILDRLNYPELRSNAENLLRAPLDFSRLNPFETLQATKTLSDNIRSHTENTVRNLQQSLASTLNEARINNAGEKLAKPRVDLLEMVSNAHDDMKDKLHGIHSDLKDRLETFQDHITEQTKLPTLRMPRLPNLLQLESPFSETTTSSNLRASQPIKFKKSQRKPGFRVNKPSQRSGQEKPVDQQANLRPFKMSKAASSLTPKSVEVPKLTVTSVKPPFAKPLERHSNVKLRKSKLIAGQEPAKFDQSRRHFLKFAENGQSTDSSNFRSGPSSSLFKSKSTPPISPITRHSFQGNERSTAKLLRPKSQSRFNFEDTSGFASEVRPSRLKPNTRPKQLVLDLDSTELRPGPSQASSVRTSTDKVVSVPKFIELGAKEMSTEKLPEMKNPVFSLPKSTESPLIAKWRESLKSKLSSPKLRSKGVQLTNDMAKSASEDKAVILSPEPMKENVSYKCKMVCYREPLNK